MIGVDGSEVTGSFVFAMLDGVVGRISGLSVGTGDDAGIDGSGISVSGPTSFAGTWMVGIVLSSLFRDMNMPVAMIKISTNTAEQAEIRNIERFCPITKPLHIWYGFLSPTRLL